MGNQKTCFCTPEKNSVTWVAFVGGIADPPHHNRLSPSICLSNRYFLRARQRNPRQKVEIIAPYPRSSHPHHRHGRSGSPNLLWLLLSSFLLYKPHPTKSCDWRAQPAIIRGLPPHWVNEPHQELAPAVFEVAGSFLPPTPPRAPPSQVVLMTPSLSREFGGSSFKVKSRSRRQI